MNKLVSVIMPTYNAERLIAASIQSALNQSYKSWELIIIDDCSTDRTADIIKGFSDTRIHYYKCDKNLGVAQARNLGISRANGEWIAFLDSDDIWEPTKLEKQIGFIEKNDRAKLVFTASSFINENGDRLDYILPAPEIVTAKELLKQNVLSCSSVLIAKEYILKIPFPSSKTLHEDYVAWLKILDEIDVAYGINEPLLIYRMSPNSKSGNKLKAANMQWNAYKEYGLNPLERIYYTFFYVSNGIKKYRKLI